MAAKRKASVLVEDMDHCYISKSPNPEIHHVFYGNANRKKSTQYGFVVPLRADYHRNTPYSVHGNPNKSLDLELKQMAQRYFETHIGNRRAFIAEFGKSYLEDEVRNE